MGRYLLLFVCLLMAACSGLPGQRSAVAIAEVSVREVIPEITVSTTLIPSERTEVRLPYDVVVKERNVQMGQFVEQGDVLATLDTAAWIGELRVLQAKLAGTAAPDHQAQLLGVTSAPEPALCPSDAPAVLEEEISTIESRMDSAQLIAPHAGVVNGYTIAAGQAAPAHEPLLEIVSTNPIYASFELAASEASSIHMGDIIQIRVDALPGESFRGEVVFVGPELHLPERSFRVWASLANPDDVLKIGMQGFAEFQTTQARQEFVVPRDAVFMHNDTPHVYAVEQNVVSLRAVTVRALDGDEALLSNGVSEGALVIERGQESLADGAIVDVR